MENDEKLFIRLRDCFTAGYTLPQYCIDNGIKKPLFVSEEKFLAFIWEVNSQFKCDKRLLPYFCFIDGDESIKNVHCSSLNGESWIAGDITIKHISLVNLDDFDKIIFLTAKGINLSKGKVIPLAELEKFFIQRAIIDIPLLTFLQHYPKVKLILTNFPSLVRYKGAQEFNEQLLEYGELVKIIKNSKSKPVKTPFDKLGYTNLQVIELLKRATVKTQLDGSTTMMNDNSPLIQIQNGKRATAYQPEKFLNRIYIFGTCYQYGFQAPFDKNIESYLQKMLNENDLPYRVENEGQFYWNRFQDMFYNLNNLTPNPGDIIFINSEGKRSNDSSIPFCDVSNAFGSPHDYKEISAEPISASSVREALKVGDFDKIKKLVPESTLHYLRGRQPARIDIKLVPNTQGDFQILSTSDDKADVRKPAWFQKGGIGYQIQSHAGKIKIVVKATADGQIRLGLRGVDVRYPKDNSKRVPYWIDYTKFIINDKIIFDKLTPAWHDKTFDYNVDVKADTEITLQIEWLLYNSDT